MRTQMNKSHLNPHYAIKQVQGTFTIYLPINNF